MAIAFPLSMPSSPGAVRAGMDAFSRVAETRSEFSDSRQAQASQGQHWRLSVELPAMLRAQAAPWIALLTALNGREGTVLAGPRPSPVPLGSVAGTPVVNGAAQSGLVLNTRGWDGLATGVLLAGDFFQLGTGGSSRLHMVVQDADADSGGESALEIWPRLRTAPADALAIDTADPVGLFALAGNLRQWSTDKNGVYAPLAFDLMEDVP